MAECILQKLMAVVREHGGHCRLQPAQRKETMFKRKDWVRSKGKIPFVGQITDVLPGGEYVIRDAERKKWLRKEDELEPLRVEGIEL